MADALSPSRSAERDVVVTREGVGLCIGKSSPSAGNARGGPRAEVAVAVAPDGFNEEEILTSRVVYTRGLEQGVDVRGVLHSNDRVIEAAGKLTQGGLWAVQVTAIVG